MKLTELKKLKNTPKSKMRSVIEGFDISELHTTMRLRREINRIKAGGNFYPTEFGELIDELCIEKAKTRYCDEDGELMFNNTIVGHLAQRDALGTSVPGYIKQLPGWKKIINAGLA